MISLVLAIVITWPQFFSRISTEGLVYSGTLKALEGKRVQLRGYVLRGVHVDGGIVVTHFAELEPHEETELEVPFDAVLVVWRKGIDVPPVPVRPTVEGVLRLGNHSRTGITVPLEIDDATPVIPRRDK